MSTIARKIRVSERQAKRVLHRLIEQDWVAVVGNSDGGRPGSSRQYRLNIRRLRGAAGGTPRTGDIHATGDTGDRRGVTPASPEPSLEPNYSHSRAHAREGNDDLAPMRESATGPPDDVPITEHIRAKLKRAGAPMPEAHHVQAMLANARSKAKVSASWEDELVAWVIREKSRGGGNENSRRSGGRRRSVFAEGVAGAFEDSGGTSGGNG